MKGHVTSQESFSSYRDPRNVLVRPNTRFPMNIKEGDKVNLTRDRIGVVRYEGPLHDRYQKSIYYGIELTKGRGSHDGLWHGTRYFTCKSSKGVFVRRKQILSLYSPTSGIPPTKPQKISHEDRKKVDDCIANNTLYEEMLMNHITKNGEPELKEDDMNDRKEFTQLIQSIDSSLAQRKHNAIFFVNIGAPTLRIQY
eukprot:469471_1